MPKVRIIRTL